jgi:hypothetical protein
LIEIPYFIYSIMTGLSVADRGVRMTGTVIRRAKPKAMIFFKPDQMQPHCDRADGGQGLA